MVLNCKGTTTGKCNAVFAIATAFVSAAHHQRRTCDIDCCHVGQGLHHCGRRAIQKNIREADCMACIFAAMTVTFLIYVVDLIVTV